MKKYLKYLILILLFVPFINVKAVSSNKVNFKITNYYVNSKIDIAGSLNVKELIVMEGTFNGYIRNLEYKTSNLPKFTGKYKDFYKSDIYNGSDIVKLKVGSLKINKESKFEDIFNVNNFFTEGKGNIGSKKIYSISETKNGENIKMFDETINGKTAFYLEYVIPNLAVNHKDVAELYFPFIGENFKNEIENYEIRVFTEGSNKNLRVWGHGPLNASIFKSKKNDGAVLKGNNLKANTPVDIRLVYDKELLMISLYKNSNVKALENIIKVETERADAANKERNINRVATFIFTGLSIFYLLLIVFLIIKVYFKYDKELKVEFNNEYFREFIDDYPVEVISYLMNKNISQEAFSASILNLIYKKNINVEKLEKKKKQYNFKLLNENNLSECEKIIINLLFKEIGKNNEVTTLDIKKASKATNKTTYKNKVYDEFINWKDKVLEASIKENFYEDLTTKKLKYSLVIVLGLIFTLFNLYFKINFILIILIIVFSLVYLIYIVVFNKKTYKGNLHYKKWCAFKKFLKDFGRFDEKELPEIKLWERYLVYATVFGLADSVEKEMKVKFENMNVKTDNDLMFNMFLYSNLASNLNTNFTSNINTASSSVNSAYSSGTGAGGGLSGGSTFGGGGGGSGF